MKLRRPVLLAALAAAAALLWQTLEWRAQDSERDAAAAQDVPKQYNEYNQLVNWPGRRAVARPGHGPRPLVAVVFGQSNAGNHGSVRTVVASKAVSIYFNGGYYEPRDPLLGASGNGGSPWPLMAERLIDAGLAERVVLVPGAVGGTSVEEWQKGGPLYAMMEARLKAARDDGLTVTHFLWHQGESDNRRNNRLTPPQYAHGLRSLIAMTKTLFPQSRFFIAQATLCGPNLPVDEDLRRTQAELQRDPGVFAGPDTDAIANPGDRSDGCHFSSTGLRKHADAWVEAISRAERTHPGPIARS